MLETAIKENIILRKLPWIRVDNSSDFLQFAYNINCINHMLHVLGQESNFSIFLYKNYKKVLTVQEIRNVDILEDLVMGHKEFESLREEYLREVYNKQDQILLI